MHTPSPHANSTPAPPRPRIIQGGMGIAVSSWQLARAVASAGQSGVASGTAIDTVVVRELQQGDPHGRLDSLRDSPEQGIVAYVRGAFFVEGGMEAGTPEQLLPMRRFQR